MTEEKNKKTILYIVEEPKTAQFRYRVENVIEALAQSDRWRGRWVLTEKLTERELSGVDLVVILRQTAKDKKILNYINEWKRRGVKVLFDVDDLIFDLRDLLTLMRGTNSRNVLYWLGYVLGIRRIAKRADGFVTTNDFLAAKLKRSFGKQVAVIKNSLNAEQLEVAEMSLKDKKHEGFVVGYFAGSPTHVKDLRLVEPEVFEFLDKHKEAKLKVVGYMEPSAELKRRIAAGQVEVCGLKNYLEQMRLMAEVDINIAPLVENDFTNCKSELKYFEAAAVETVTIASPTFAFKEAIRDGENGFLAAPGQWQEKMDILYTDQERRRTMAKAARVDALKKYYGKNFLKRVEEAYGRYS